MKSLYPDRAHGRGLSSLMVIKVKQWKLFRGLSINPSLLNTIREPVFRFTTLSVKFREYEMIKDMYLRAIFQSTDDIFKAYKRVNVAF